MSAFFLVLSAITTALLGAAFFFVKISPDRLYHLYFGLIATVSALLTHCWIFFYFIGTGQGIREGIIENKLDVKSIRMTKKFKGRTFPFAFFSIVFIIVGAVMGGALRAARVSPAAHWGWILFAIIFNFWTFRQEYRVLRENEALMAGLNRQIGDG
jgi:hypothetical protein